MKAVKDDLRWPRSPRTEAAKKTRAAGDRTTACARRSCAARSSRTTAGHDGRRFDEIRTITRRGRRAAAHPRLGALHPRRDPGAGHGHPRHLRGRADHRHRAGAGAQEALHAALQLPALLGGRGQVPARPRPPRDRPRRAGRARAARDAARRGRVPLHGAHRVRHPRVERLVVDGLDLRRHARPDGRRRAPEEPGGRRRHGPRQGRRHATPSSPTSPARKTTTATWTSRSPAPATGITALQMDIKIGGITRRDHGAGARAGARRAACTSSTRWPRRWPAPRAEHQRVRAAHPHHPASRSTRSATSSGPAAR